MPDADIMSRVMNSNVGAIIISAILGLGLASLFRKVCRDRNCIIIKGPPLKKIKNKIFKFDNKCYTYEPVATSCKA